MLVLNYFNWAGTSAEFKEFREQIKGQVNAMNDVKLVGIFIPTSEWHYVVVFDVATYETALQTYKAYAEKYGALKVSLGKLELFHTIEEIPFL